MPAANPLRCGRDGQLDPALLGAVTRIAAAGRAPRSRSCVALARPGRGTVPVLLALPEPRARLRPSAASGLLTAAGLGDLRRRRRAGRARRRAGARGRAGGCGHRRGRERDSSRASTSCASVGGADSYFDADTLDWLDSQPSLARDDVRGRLSHRAKRRLSCCSRATTPRRALELPSLAMVTRRGARAASAHAATATRAASARGSPQAIRAPRAGSAPGRAGRRHLSATSTASATAATSGASRCCARSACCATPPPTYAPADCWGDVGAASARARLRAGRREPWRADYARGPRALVWAGSDGGLRGAALLEAPRRGARARTMPSVAVNPPKTPVTKGSMRHRHRHHAQRLQDARPAARPSCRRRCPTSARAATRRRATRRPSRSRAIRSRSRAPASTRWATSPARPTGGGLISMNTHGPDQVRRARGR